MSYKKGGLKMKYRIQKFKGLEWKCGCREACCPHSPEPVFEDVDPNAKYFVLRYDTDPHAREAMVAYANSVRLDNEVFANDIIKELKNNPLKAEVQHDA